VPFEILIGNSYPGISFTIWKKNSGGPDNWVLAGMDAGGPVYVCAAHHNGSQFVGKMFKGNCYFEYGGKEEVKFDLDYLMLARTVPPPP
jgi:hypothetical protein